MNLLTKRIYAAIVAFLISTSLPSAQGGIANRSEIFSDWLVTCDETQGCRISQTIVQPSTNRLILQLKVFHGEQPTMLFSFPLGILLNTGWQYQIDGGRQTLLPFEICNSEGCHVGIELTPTLLRSMKRGSKMSVKFFDAAQTEINPVISLIGFTKAYEAIK